MFRNITVLLKEEIIPTNFLNVATNIAKSSNAKLTGVYVLPLSRTMLNMPDIVDVETFRNKAQKVREKFESSLRISGLEGIWNYSECRDVATEVARQGLYADLIMLSLAGGDYRDIDNILMVASCPTLLLPAHYNSNGNFKKVLVAWKNTRESARALHDSLPILHAAQEVEIITFSDNKNEKELLISYLNTHNIGAKVEQKPIDSSITEYGMPMEIDKVIGEKIIERSIQSEYDLIVMGCFGHSRLGDAVLSGVTLEVSRNTKLPVLMSH